MSAAAVPTVVVAVAAGAVVHLLLGVRPTWPWRVADLAPTRRGLPQEGSGVVRRTSRPGRSGLRARQRAGLAGRARPVRRRARSEQRRVESDLPGVVDLLHVAVTAGHSLHGAVRVVGSMGTGPVSTAVAEVAAAVDRGGSLAEELRRLPDRLGPQVRPLATTLGITVVSGAPLGPALQRLADAERRRLRRRAEERVRRLPILLLAPLVGLVLPAFVVLTIVPVVVSTARSGLLPALR